MAVVYAEFDRILEFSEKINDMRERVADEARFGDSVIPDTLEKLNMFLDSAIIYEQNAEERKNYAQTALDQEIRRVDNYNSNLQEDQSPITVAQYYFDRVDYTCEIYKMAQDRRKMIQDTIEDFNSYSSAYKSEQSSYLSDYNTLLRESTEFFATYIEALEKAKEAIYEKAYDNTANINQSSGGINCNDLDEKDISIIAKATKWPEKIIQQKCSKSGNIYFYKTNNYSMEGKYSPQGVYYSRSKFVVGGVSFEGIFPEFDSFFDVTDLPKSMWTRDSYSKHERFCNNLLRDKVKSDPIFAGNFSPLQIKQIFSGKTPSGYTWHHHQTPGKLQLVRKQQHTARGGGAGHTGGQSLWCRR